MVFRLLCTINQWLSMLVKILVLKISDILSEKKIKFLNNRKVFENHKKITSVKSVNRA